MKFAEALPLLSEKDDPFDLEETLANGIGEVLNVNPNKINRDPHGMRLADVMPMEITNGSFAMLKNADKFSKAKIQTSDGFWRIDHVTSRTSFRSGRPTTKISLSVFKV